MTYVLLYDLSFTLYSCNIYRTSLVLTRKTRSFTVKQKQIGLRNYLPFSPVKFSRMNMLVKGLKVQKFVSNSLEK